MGRGRDARRPEAGVAQGLGAPRAKTRGEGAPALRVGLYVYGFVRPKTGRVFWLVMPTVNAEAFSLALSRFARWVSAGEDKRVVLVLDRAGWHVAKDLKVPEGLELEFLPPRSPELMPAERLWPLLNERVANRPFEDLGELEGALVERCLALSERPDLLRGHTRYRWWPEAA